MTAPRSKKSVKPHGQIRQSQVVTTFGRLDARPAEVVRHHCRA